MRLTSFYEEADSGKSLNVHVGFDSQHGAEGAVKEHQDSTYAWSGSYSLESHVELRWWWSKLGRVTVFAIDRLATQRLVERELTLEYPPTVDPLAVSGRLVADTEGHAALEIVLVDATTGQVHISPVVVSRQGEEDIHMQEGESMVAAQFNQRIKRAAVVDLSEPKVVVAASDSQGNIWRLVVDVDSNSDGSTDEQLWLPSSRQPRKPEPTAQEESSGWTGYFRGKSVSTPARARSPQLSEGAGIRCISPLPGHAASILVTYADNTAIALSNLDADENQHAAIPVAFQTLTKHEDWNLTRVEPVPRCNSEYAAFWDVGGSLCVQLLNLCTASDGSYVMATSQKVAPDSSVEFWAPHPDAVPRTITYTSLSQGDASGVGHLLWSSPLNYGGAAVGSVLSLATDVAQVASDQQLEEYVVSTFTLGSSHVALDVPSSWSIVTQSHVTAVFHLCAPTALGALHPGQPIVCRADLHQGSLGLSIVWNPVHPMSQGSAVMNQMLHEPCVLGEWGDYLTLPTMDIGTQGYVVALSPTDTAVSTGVGGGDSTVVRVLEESLAVIEAIPLGLREIKRMLHEALNNPLRAATLPRYTEIRLFGRKMAPAAEISDEDMDAVVDYVLRSCADGFTSTVIPSLSRRFVSSAILQEFADRALILLIAHAGWCSTSNTFATSPVLDRVRFAFQVLGGGLLTARSLGPWLSALSDGNSFNTVQDVLNTFLAISEDHDSGKTLSDLMGMGRLLTTLVPGESHAIRAVQRWVSVWSSKYPLLFHFEVLAQIACGRTSGTSSAKIGHMISLLVSVVDSAHPSVLKTGELVHEFAVEEESRREVLDELQKDPANVYRAVMLRHLVKRVDDMTAVPACDLSIITPNLLLPVKKLLQRLSTANGSNPPTSLIISLQCLVDDATVLQLGHAVAEQDIESSTRLLLDLLKNQQNARIVRHFTEALVNGLLAEEMGELLVDYASSNAALSHLITIELFQHVVRPKTTSTDRAERERKRESNTMVLYCFLVNCGALGTAARVMYEVGSSMRMAPQCTAMTLSYAHRALATAVETVRMIPTALPPRTGSGAADAADVDDPFARAHSQAGNTSMITNEQSVYMEHRHYGGMEPLTRGDLESLVKHEVQLRMELKLLVAARPIECISFDRQEPAQIDFLVRELLQIRKFEAALTLAQAWERDLSVIFNSHASELLEGHIHDANEQWSTLNRRIMACSGVHNNYKYLRTTVSFVVSHAKATRVDESLPALLKEVDPSGLVGSYLAAPRVTKDVATNIFNIVCDYYQGKRGGDAELVRLGFSQKATITVTVLDRVVVLAQSTFKKTVAGVGAAAGGGNAKVTAADLKAQTALNDLAYDLLRAAGAQ